MQLLPERFASARITRRVASVNEFVIDVVRRTTEQFGFVPSVVALWNSLAVSLLTGGVICFLKSRVNDFPFLNFILLLHWFLLHCFSAFLPAGWMM